jgi:hypothetical protein
MRKAGVIVVPRYEWECVNVEIDEVKKRGESERVGLDEGMVTNE